MADTDNYYNPKRKAQDCLDELFHQGGRLTQPLTIFDSEYMLKVLEKYLTEAVTKFDNIRTERYDP